MRAFVLLSAILWTVTGFAAPAVQTKRPAPTTPPASLPALPPSPYDVILKRNLFIPLPPPKALPGQQQKATIAAATMLPEPEPLDKLYGLAGTVVSTDEGKSTAFIEDLRKKEVSFYHKGDTLQDLTLSEIRDGGAVFTTITGDRLLLATGGLRYLDSAGRTVQFRVNLEEAVRQIQEDDELLASLKAAPSVESGKTLGYKIEGITEGSIIESLGILNSDVFTTVNTVPLDGTRAPLKIYETLLEAGTKTVIVRILRAGKPLNIVYHLE